MRLKKHRLYCIARNALKQAIDPGPYERKLFDDSSSFPPIEPVSLTWPDHIRKPRVGLVPDPHHLYPYWTKYRRFLETNGVPYVIYDIHRSDWLALAKDLDMIIWRPFSSPPDLEECRRKVFVLEHQLGKLCYPSHATALLYEDKILQFELLRFHGLPAIETFISHSYEEVVEALPNMRFPVISKLIIGSGSFGTELVRDERAARKLARQAFSFAGRRTYWPYLRQKDYVYFQRFVPGATFDLRVLVIGDSACGYFRDVPDGEFRASGMHSERRGELPGEALSIAREVARQLNLLSVAVDLLYDNERREYQIIELSIFVEVQSTSDAPAQVDGTFGLYRFNGESLKWVFEPREFWLQELVLKEYLRRTWLTAGHHPKWDAPQVERT